MSKKHKKVCTIPNYIEHFLILASVVSGYISISAFGSLIGSPIRITSSAVRLQICAITAAIRKYKSVISNKKKMHEKLVLFANTKLNSIEVLISRALIDSYISHDEFFFNILIYS